MTRLHNGFIHQRCTTLSNPPAVLAELLHALRSLSWAEIGCYCARWIRPFLSWRAVRLPAFAQALASARRRRGSFIWNLRPIIP